MIADAAAILMSVETFVVWQQSQADLYELIDGAPSLYRGTKAAAEMMAGGSSLHDRIITNIIIALGNQLSDGPCRPATADLGLRTKIRSLRRADLLVTCEPPSGDSYEAIEPRVVVEVLSPSNVGVAWERKLNEYRRHGKLEYILLVDARVMDVKLYTRTAAGWDDADFAGAADGVGLPGLGCAMSLAAIYRGTGLEAQPRSKPLKMRSSKSPRPVARLVPRLAGELVFCTRQLGPSQNPNFRPGREGGHPSKPDVS